MPSQGEYEPTTTHSHYTIDDWWRDYRRGIYTDLCARITLQDVSIDKESE
jgi:hypothetical protein